MRGLTVGDFKIGFDFSTNATTVHVIDNKTGKYTEGQVYHETCFDVVEEKIKADKIKKEKEPKNAVI